MLAPAALEASTWPDRFSCITWGDTNDPLGGQIVLKHIQSKQDWNEKSLGAKGFTLIELLVVIVILGVLAAVVVFSVTGIQDKSKESACAQELRTIETALESYRAQNPSYPATIAALGSGSAKYLRKSAPADLLGVYTYDNTTGVVTQGQCPKP